MTQEKNKTETLIEAALLRIQKGKPKIVKKGRKLSIKSISEEAKISPSTIHNRYPDLADKIRGLLHKTPSERMTVQHSEMRKLRERNKALRKEIAQLKEDLAKSVSIQLRLQKEMSN